MKRKSTPAQKWAQERNWSKAQLLGIRGQCINLQYKKSTLSYEIITLDSMIKSIDSLLKKFKAAEPSSKRVFLGLFKRR